MPYNDDPMYDAWGSVIDPGEADMLDLALDFVNSKLVLPEGVVTEGSRLEASRVAESTALDMASFESYLRSNVIAGAAYYEHPGRVETEDVEMPVEAFMDIMQSILSHSVDPLKAVLAISALAPKAKFKKWQTEKVKRMITRGVTKGSLFIDFNFNTTEIEKVVNNFEQRVATCFGSNDLWKQVTEAVLDRTIVKTSIEDLLLSLTQSAKIKETEYSAIPGTMKFKRIGRKLIGSLGKVRDIAFNVVRAGSIMGTGEIATEWFTGKVEGWDVGRLTSLVDRIMNLSMDVENDIGALEDVDSISEYTESIDNYVVELEDIFQEVGNMYGNFKDVLPDYYNNVLSNIAVLQFSVKKTVESLYKGRESIEGRRSEVTELRGTDAARTAVADAGKGDFHTLKATKFWDFYYNYIDPMGGISMIEYISRGFSEDLEKRLEEMNVFSESIRKEFAEAERIIFEEADDRAERTFGTFVKQHFANLSL